MRMKRWDPGCFSIEENGTVKKVVSMGGRGAGMFGNFLATAEILDVTSMQWKNLPRLPFRVWSNKGVESVMGPYLGFSVGGTDLGGHDEDIRSIMGLRKNRNGNYYWKKVNRLPMGITNAAVVNAPMSMVPCSR